MPALATISAARVRALVAFDAPADQPLPAASLELLAAISVELSRSLRAGTRSTLDLLPLRARRHALRQHLVAAGEQQPADAPCWLPGLLLAFDQGFDQLDAVLERPLRTSPRPSLETFAGSGPALPPPASVPRARHEGTSRVLPETCALEGARRALRRRARGATPEEHWRYTQSDRVNAALLMLELVLARAAAWMADCARER